MTAGAAVEALPGVARYVYAVVPSGTALPQRRGELAVVEAGGLAAVVSAVPDPLLLYAATADELEPAVREHEAVLEELMQAAPVVPMRFGTVVRSPDALRELLEACGAVWRRSLDRVSGRAEWSLKVWWDGGWPLRPRRDPVVAGGSPEPAGLAYLRERRLARDRGNMTRREVAEAAASVERDVAASSAEWLPADGSARAAAPDDRRHERRTLLLHSVCLLERAAEHSFLDALSASLERHGHGHLTAEVTGPWPPYHFVGAAPTSSPGAGGGS